MEQALAASPLVNKPELIAPAGNWECARAAVANEANAIYFGLPRFNARMRAENFTMDDLPVLVKFLHEHNVRALCTVNTLIFSDELAEAERTLLALDAAGVDAVIVQDLGLARLAAAMNVRFAVHASTQMTITSPEGARFASRLGMRRVVIARETSLRELAKFGDVGIGLETFVHGALCVAYSGQCLTSEALGQRSANRGECAQACRLPYELIVDGVVRNLGDRRYLLSPQDLAAVREIPELVRLGVRAFKIEGRLKTPEYVAATCQVYRKAIDQAISSQPSAIGAGDDYKLEMAFSRGLFSGWMHGVNHQELVHARFGKKRGAFIGRVTRVGDDFIEVTFETPVRAGDGVVFDTGGDTDREQGGVVFIVRGKKLYFRHGQIRFATLKAGDRVWKTSDPKLQRELRKSFTGQIPKPKHPLDLCVSGTTGESMIVSGNGVTAHSTMPLQAARTHPLTTAILREQLGRLGDTEFELGELRNELRGDVILPLRELNRLRRELIEKLPQPRTRISTPSPKSVLTEMLASIRALEHTPTIPTQELIVLCRTMEQVQIALEEGIRTLYVDFEDLRRYTDAVALVRSHSPITNHQSPISIFLATPRIQKTGEQGFFTTIEKAAPDGVLIRNLGAIEFFRAKSMRRIGDFSLNVSNPLTAELLIREGLDRLTVSYDLNAQQALDLLRATPPQWFEMTIHQHIPMFHMEHCVFAAFMSNGTDHTNCGRPCDRHDVRLRDRVGAEHPLKADVGCRNTVYHAKAQSGAEFFRAFREADARTFRIELLGENAGQTRETICCYRGLLQGTITPADLSRRLKVVNQLGVTSGTLTVLD